MNEMKRYLQDDFLPCKPSDRTLLIQALRDIRRETTHDIAGLTRDEALNIISWVAEVSFETLQQVEAAQ